MDRTVLLIHGMWATPHAWRHWRGDLESRGWQVMAPTLRLHDAPPLKAPRSMGTISLLDYAADLEAAIAKLPSRPVIIGHSMGGLLAQMLAARGLCRAAVLLCPAPPAGVLALHPSVLRAFLRIQLRWGWWRLPQRPTYNEAMYGTFNTCTDRIACGHDYGRFVHDSGRVLLEVGLPFLDRNRAARVDPRAITCPTLVIGAEKDRLTPARVVRKVARRYESVAEHHQFAGQGHWVLGQPGWKDVAGYVGDWLERTLTPTAGSATPGDPTPA